MTESNRPSHCGVGEPPRRKSLRPSLRVLATGLTASVSLACSDAAEDRASALPAPSEAAGDDSSASEQGTSHQADLAYTLADGYGAGDPCEVPSAVECKVNLPSQGGVTNCFVGVRICEDGYWGDCVSNDAAEQLLEQLASPPIDTGG